MVSQNVRLELFKYLLHEGWDPEGVLVVPEVPGRRLDTGQAIEPSQGCRTNYLW